MIYNPIFISGRETVRHVLPKDVNFYDYDGTLLYSYTLAEAQALTDLPKSHTHEGLTFLGWNWSLEKIKTLNRPVNVGAQYITDDGKTRLKIRVWSKLRNDVSLSITQNVANGVTIDWGDGSAAETLSATGNNIVSHPYEIGDYTITLTVADGCTMGFGNGTSAYCIMGDSSNFGKVYCNLLREAYIGRGVTTIGSYAFQNCYSLSLITIPDAVKSIGGAAFQGCSSLSAITIPDSVTSVGNYVFHVCYSLIAISFPDSVPSIGNYTFRTCSVLPAITIPDSVTSIGNNAFEGCSSLSAITIPDSVTSIGSSAFQNCYGVAEYSLESPTPPTLSAANAFTNIPSDCVIRVPAGSLETYKTAANWSTYADRMQEGL